MGGIYCADYVSDLNTLIAGQTGMFIPGCLNSPVSSDYGICIAFGGSTWIWQIVFVTRNYSTRFYLRSNINNEGWTGWRGFQTAD